MKNPRAALVATAIPLLVTSLRVTAAGELPFNTPATEEARQSAPLLQQTARALHDADEAISNVWLFPTAEANVVFARYDVAGSALEHLVELTVNGNRIVESRELTSASAELVSNETPKLHWSALIGTGDAARASPTQHKVASSSETNVPPSPHWTANIGTGTAAASNTIATDTRQRPSSAAQPVIAVANWSSRIGTGHALDSIVPVM
jgi:hypothetical protein